MLPATANDAMASVLHDRRRKSFSLFEICSKVHLIIDFEFFFELQKN